MKYEKLFSPAVLDGSNSKTLEDSSLVIETNYGNVIAGTVSKFAERDTSWRPNQDRIVVLPDGFFVCDGMSSDEPSKILANTIAEFSTINKEVLQEAKKRLTGVSAGICFAGGIIRANILHTFSVGDSGVFVVRNIAQAGNEPQRKIRFRSKIDRVGSGFSERLSRSFPSDNFFTETCELQQGDRIYAFSDGILDNFLSQGGELTSLSKDISSLPDAFKIVSDDIYLKMRLASESLNSAEYLANLDTIQKIQERRIPPDNDDTSLLIADYMPQ